MTTARVLLETRTYKRTHGVIHHECGSSETLAAEVPDTRHDLMVARLTLKLESAFRDAQRLHLCAVADAIMAARVELKRSAKARLGVQP